MYLEQLSLTRLSDNGQYQYALLGDAYGVINGNRLDLMNFSVLNPEDSDSVGGQSLSFHVDLLFAGVTNDRDHSLISSWGVSPAANMNAVQVDDYLLKGGINVYGMILRFTI